MSKHKAKTIDGEEVSREFVEDLVREAEAGYEGYEFEWVPKPGRPPLSDGGPSRRVQVRVPEQTGAQIDLIAERNGKTVSEIVREAIDRYLADAA